MFKAAITFGGRVNDLHLISNKEKMWKCAIELIEMKMEYVVWGW